MSAAVAPEVVERTPLAPHTAEPGGVSDAADAAVVLARRRNGGAHLLAGVARARAAVRTHPVATTGSALVLATALVPVSALRAERDGAAAADVTLATPAVYVAISPFARLADVLCVLSTAQHAALAVTLLVVAAAWKVARRCPQASALRTCARASGACALSLVAFVVLLAGAVFAPRPMASLVAQDADEVRVDFHTHTNASHDVPGWFTPERRRAWHTDAGFDVAYVSDHKRVAGALAAAHGNPARAGTGLSVLPAIESWWNGIHVIVLGTSALDPAFRADEQVDRALPAAIASGRLAGRPLPVVLAAIPDDVLRALTPAARDSAPWLRGVEVADGAPRAIAQRDRERAAITERAAALGILPVAATNHHGWGRTAVAWNLVRVPGWQALTPEALGTRIEDVLRRGDAGALRVVTRARPQVAAAGAPRLASLVATLPALVWQVAAELDTPERAVWLLWLWAPALLTLMWHRRSERPSARGPMASAVQPGAAASTSRTRAVRASSVNGLCSTAPASSSGSAAGDGPSTGSS